MLRAGNLLRRQFDVCHQLECAMITERSAKAPEADGREKHGAAKPDPSKERCCHLRFPNDRPGYVLVSVGSEESTFLNTGICDEVTIR